MRSGQQTEDSPSHGCVHEVWNGTRDGNPVHSLPIPIYSALQIYRGLFSQNISRKTPIARPLGRGMGVFCEILIWPKFLPSKLVHCVRRRVIWYRDISRVHSTTLFYSVWIDRLYAVLLWPLPFSSYIISQLEHTGPCNTSWYFDKPTAKVMWVLAHIRHNPNTLESRRNF